MALPLRRKIAAPWDVMIARTSSVDPEIILNNKSGTIVRTGGAGELYFYANEPVSGLPFLLYRFYERRTGAVQITLELQ
jgi:hypothetical protein